MASNIIFATSALLAALILWRSFKSATGSAVETVRSRLLLQTAIASAVVFGIVALLLSATAIVRFVRGVRADVFGVLVPAVLSGLSLYTFFNWFLSPRRLRRIYGLTPCDRRTLIEQCRYAAEMMGVTPPRIWVSPKIGSPIVFGLSSGHASLAIPDEWQDTDDPCRRVMVLHELAHLRNRDVGFLAIAASILRGTNLGVVSAILAAAIVPVASAEAGHHLRLTMLYLLLLVQLRILHVITLRHRETMADRVMSLLTSRADFSDAMAQQLLVLPRRPLAGGGGSGRWSSKVEAWLSDKALFSSRRRFWAIAYRLQTFLTATHPVAAARTAAAPPDAYGGGSAWDAGPGDCLIIGSVVGTLAATASVGGYWCSHQVFGWHDARAVFMGLRMLGAIAVPAIAIVASLFMAPVWAAVRSFTPTALLLLKLLSQLALCSIIAALACLQILLVGQTLAVSEALLWKTVLCCTLIFGSALVLCFGLSGIWLLLRYFAQEDLTDLSLSLRLQSPLALLLSLLAIAYIRWIPTRPVLAGLTTISFLVGMHLIRRCLLRSIISRHDEYSLLRLAGREWHFEGRELWQIRCLALRALIAGMGTAAALACFAVGYWFVHGIDLAPDALISFLLILTLFGLERLYGVRRYDSPNWMHRLQRIYILMQLQRILDFALRRQNTGRTDAIMPSWQGDDLSLEDRAIPGTMNMVFVATETFFDLVPEHWRSHTLRWLRACQTATGFGAFPGCSARLSATYYGLTLCNRLGASSDHNSGRIAQWILECLRPDGSFRGAFSRHPAHEDTWHAIRALRMMDRLPQGDARQACVSWVRRCLDEAMLGRGSPNAVYHCCESLIALDGLDPPLQQRVNEWAERQFCQEAVGSLAKDATVVLRLLPVLRCCGRLQSATGELRAAIDSLAARVDAALDAELRKRGARSLWPWKWHRR